MRASQLWLKISVIIVGVSMLINCRSMPPGMNATSPLYPLENAKLWVDNTAIDSTGQRHVQQEIFSQVFFLIEQAQQLILLDMFLFNDFQGPNPETHRALAQELTDTLIAKKASSPNLPIIFITDPFNQLYGGLNNLYLSALRQAGVQVVITDLTALPDSNPSWSVIWRACCQWFGNNPNRGWLPNPVGAGKVTLRTYLALINFKANHRKTLVVDEGETWTTLIASANPHDGSSAHTNTALSASGAIALAVLQSELAVIAFSAPDILTQTQWPQGVSLETPPTSTPSKQTPQVQLITEGAIESALLTAINTAQKEEQLWLEVFYFSHFKLQKALLEAHQRGVKIQVILDPNKDAFGREKNGIPNRQVAKKLHEAGIPVRWCHTHGEQCHSKWLLKQGAKHAELILGSANFTRRNLGNLNLETNLRILADKNEPAIARAIALYQSHWHNQPFEDSKEAMIYTVDYEKYQDNSRWRRLLYQAMERTGWSSF